MAINLTVVICKQPENMSSFNYSELLWEKAIRCVRACEEARLKSAFTQEQHQSFRLCMRTYWRAHTDPTIQNFVRYTISLYKLQKNSSSTRASSQISSTVNKSQKSSRDNVKLLLSWAYRTTDDWSLLRQHHTAKQPDLIVKFRIWWKFRRIPSSVKKSLLCSKSWPPRHSSEHIASILHW